MKQEQVYPIRYFAIGHSYLRHGPFTGWQRKGTWGMAASEPDADYFHRVRQHLHESLPCNVEAYGENFASYERLCTVDATKETYTQSPLYARMVEILRTMRPNLITVFVGGGNTVAKDPDSLTLFYEVLYSMIQENMPENATVICPNTNKKASVWMEIAQKYGFIPVDLRFIHQSGKGRENPYYAYNQYPDYDEAAAAGAVEFRTHPGDHGHDTIGRLIVEAAAPMLRQRVELESLGVPESMKLCAPESVCEEIQLKAILQPEGCAAGVSWLCDDENIAKLSQSGVLTPVANGTVTVTARSDLRQELTESIRITVTGQKEEEARVIVAPTDSWSFETPQSREGIKMGGFNVRYEDGVGKASSAPGTGVSVYHDSLKLDTADYKKFCLRFQIDCHDPEMDVTVQITTTEKAHDFLLNVKSQEMTDVELDISPLAGTITGFRIHPETEEGCIHVAKIAFLK